MTKVRDIEEFAAYLGELLPIYRDKKSSSDSTAPSFILPGKRFGSVGRGKKATKGKHFLN